MIARSGAQAREEGILVLRELGDEFAVSSCLQERLALPRRTRLHPYLSRSR
jgi:hypothetical protein